MPLLQVFPAAMIEPIAESFRQLITRWIVAPRRIILGALRATELTKHHSAYHRLFAIARWPIDQVGLKMFDLVVNDTLVHKTGLKVYGVGTHRDACQSSS
ncbi:hypothetical protein K227x_54720 [Rubripirellula lacrimiformis]|uniref:Uncharacterized protein n=1 Tax=Rubripirellula lacrimiformis TaxID=1930273 RepID=A0A517NIT3_9BACT|nr:hypothetical protein [Rubripirellula lacrimiformis]QDT07047.1 hypothetical protein K227x_54720 [Rubripirellula lacrimiformis]